VLAFREVDLPAGEGYEVGLTGVSLELKAGQLVVVAVEEEILPELPLADAAQGLIGPAAGRIEFLGRPWEEWTHREACSLRGLVGRVSAGTSLLNNLDIDENVTLPGRYHGFGTHSSLLQEADQLAKRFGLPEIARCRPAVATRKQRAVAVWARAFLGPKRLIILEGPTREVARETAKRFCTFAAEQAATGKAVLWITGSPWEVQNTASFRTALFELTGTRLQMRTEVSNDQTF